MAKRKPRTKQPSGKPKPPPNRPGPKIPDIDPSVVEGMASIGCTKTDIAKVLGICLDTLNNRFSEFFDKGIANRNLRLRQAMWRSALDKGNTVMQIWLSKQYLGMTEKQEIVTEEKARVIGQNRVEILEMAARRARGESITDDAAG